MRRPVVAPLLVAAAATALTWRIPLAPSQVPNIDASWTAALFLAGQQGLHFGPDLAFPYGPLGFLSRPVLYYTAPATLAVLAVGVAYVSSLFIFARLLWRRLGPGWAVVLTLLAASATATVDGPERVEAIFVLIALGVVLDDSAELGRGTMAGLGALTALMGLVKVNSGAAMLVMLVVIGILPVARRRPRSEVVRIGATALGSLVLAGVVLWLLAGQNLGDLPDYVHNGRELATGYPDNMSLEEPGLGGDYVWAAIAVAALAVAAAFALRPLRRANQVIGAVLLVFYTWVAFRHGFTRHDLGHTVLFSAPLLLILAALVPATGARAPWSRARAAQMAAICVAALALGVGSMAHRRFADLFVFSTDSVVDTVRTLGSKGNRVRVREGARTALRTNYALPPDMVRRVSGQTVHVDPWEAGLAWADPYIHWRPVPVFQSYTAYTNDLDDLDADFLGGSKAPRYVLHQNLSLNNRNARFESPRYVEQLVCRYRQVSVGSGWQLLQRGADLCGRPVQLVDRRVRLGEEARVPKAGRDDVVVGRFEDLGVSAWQKLRGLVFKRSPLNVGLGGGRVNRFLPGHAANPHVLKVPACLDYDPGMFDLSAYPTVSIAHEGHIGRPEGSGGYRLRIYRVPFRCPGSLPQR